MKKLTINRGSTGRARSTCQLEFLKPKKQHGTMVSKFDRTSIMKKEIVLFKKKKMKRESYLIGYLSNSTLDIFVVPIQKLILQFSGHLLKSSDKSLVYFVFF